MTYHVSTGLRNGMLDDGCLKQILHMGVIMIYDGPVPASADAALDAANHLLVTITTGPTGGSGLTFEDNAVNGGLAKKSTEIWGGTIATTGTATFYRHIGGDEWDGTIGAQSTTLPRLQGAIGVYGAEINLTNTTLTVGGTQTIDYYFVGLPTL